MTGEPEYFGYIRTDVLSYVPDNVETVLTLGCGFGNTEKLLVDKGVSVVGIEPSSKAAKVARENGITVIEKFADDALAELKGQTFDCLIFSDVLEHLPQPLPVLQSSAELLKKDGIVVISVPNFRHYSVFSEVFLKGVVPDRDAGIFDRTHLQITTRKRIERWYEECGMTVVAKEYKFARRLERLLSTLSFGLLNEFLAPQVIVCGRK
jgi:2-polyprenyl-3-methyl-5-hydroxy-6-metoxy-1,4-benzoquinol methylase